MVARSAAVGVIARRLRTSFNRLVAIVFAFLMLAAVVLGTWVVGGLFLDGWAHVNQPGLETFFSPWHGVFYLGFLVSSVVLPS